MIQCINILLIVLLWQTICSPLPAGPADSETISVAQPVGPAPGFAHVSPEDIQAMQVAQDLTKATCPVVVTLLQEQAKEISPPPPTSKRLVRRGITTTPFGTRVETVPLEAQASMSNIANLEYNAGTTGAASVHVQILDNLDDHQLGVPRWVRLDGQVADLTIEQGHQDVVYNPQGGLRSEQALRQGLHARLQDLDRVAKAAFNLILPDRDDSYFSQTLGGLNKWYLTISPFSGKDGFSYTFRRTEGQPAVVPSDWGSDARASGAALLVLDSPPIVPTDAVYIQVLLQVLNDLSTWGYTFARYRQIGPAPTANDITESLALMGSGVGQIGGSNFLNSAVFTQRLYQSRLCQRGPPGVRI